MLSAEKNERLTRVGPGTPMGELLRRYWWPVATHDIATRVPVRRRLLGEDLVLYKDGSGQCGLVDRHCAHRRADLSYGWVEDCGLRCHYHGWLWDRNGRCLAQPFEETAHPEARFKDRVRIKAYPVEVKAGRSTTLALRWLVGYSRQRREKTMTERLMNELLDASNGLGASVKRREDTHKMAESNKAFAHYRW